MRRAIRREKDTLFSMRLWARKASWRALTRPSIILYWCWLGYQSLRDDSLMGGEARYWSLTKIGTSKPQYSVILFVARCGETIVIVQGSRNATRLLIFAATLLTIFVMSLRRWNPSAKELPQLLVVCRYYLWAANRRNDSETSGVYDW